MVPLTFKIRHAAFRRRSERSDDLNVLLGLSLFMVTAHRVSYGI